MASQLLHDVAAQLAPTEGQGKDRGWARVNIAKSLAEFVRNLVGAEVGFVRECRTRDELLLLGGTDAVAWRPGFVPPGEVPLHKFRPHGLCQDLSRVYAASRADRPTGMTTPPPGWEKSYSDAEQAFMKWIGSEAWIPIRYGEGTFAVVLVASADESFFDARRIGLLEACQVFIQTIFHLAAASDERAELNVALPAIIKVLPLLVEAPGLPEFWRAVCAILTCHRGFEFSRAMLFWVRDESHPPDCEMAVGALGELSPDWPRDNHVPIEQAHPFLRDYIHEAFDQPEPVGDPLYQAIKAKPVRFEPTDSGVVRTVLEGTNRDDAPELTHSDPWVERVRREHRGVFASPHGQYFVFPLVALDTRPPGSEGPERTLLGFVVADLAYKPSKHIPGPGNPNLGVVALLLRLVAGIWRARERSESYFQILTALPALRHHGPYLGFPVAHLAAEVEKPFDDWNCPMMQKHVRQLAPRAAELGAAAEVVMDLRAGRQAAGIPHLADWLEQAASRLQPRYPGLTIRVVPASGPRGTSRYNGAAGMAAHFLDPILHCLVSNAVEAAGGRPVQVVLSAARVDVPECATEVGGRVLITVANDGPPIAPTLAPYLFVNQVSTHDHSTTHRGSGLSSSRLIAQSHGGDVVLLDPGRGAGRLGALADVARRFLRLRRPVRFGIVLNPDLQSASPGGSAP